MFTTIERIKEVLSDILEKDRNERARSSERKAEDLKKEIEELKLKKRLEEEEIKHLVKMIELTKEFNKREMDLQRDYHEKIVAAIEDQRKESKELYSAIMERLPNVNVDIKKG